MGKIQILFLYPDSDPDQSQNVMGSKLDQDQSPGIFVTQVSISSICLILLTNKQANRETNGHENNTSLAEEISHMENIESTNRTIV